MTDAPDNLVAKNHFTSMIGIRSIENGFIVTLSAGPAYGSQQQSGEVYYADLGAIAAAASAFIPQIEDIASEQRLLAARKAKP